MNSASVLRRRSGSLGMLLGPLMFMLLIPQARLESSEPVHVRIVSLEKEVLSYPYRHPNVIVRFLPSGHTPKLTIRTIVVNKLAERGVFGEVDIPNLPLKEWCHVQPSFDSRKSVFILHLNKTLLETQIEADNPVHNNWNFHSIEITGKGVIQLTDFPPPLDYPIPQRASFLATIDHQYPDTYPTRWYYYFGRIDEVPILPLIISGASGVLFCLIICAFQRIRNRKPQKVPSVRYSFSTDGNRTLPRTTLFNTDLYANTDDAFEKETVNDSENEISDEIPHFMYVQSYEHYFQNHEKFPEPSSGYNSRSDNNSNNSFCDQNNGCSDSPEIMKQVELLREYFTENIIDDTLDINTILDRTSISTNPPDSLHAMQVSPIHVYGNQINGMTEEPNMTSFKKPPPPQKPSRSSSIKFKSDEFF